MTNYFLIGDETIRSEGMSGIHLEMLELIYLTNRETKIIFQGMIFPILLHELGQKVW